MKQNTRVVVAGALVLGLAAGGGTFALWSASSQVDGGGINTGALNVASNGAAVYDDLSTPSVPSDWNNATDKMVPSDKVAAQQSFTLTLVGKNLKAKLNVNGGTTSPTDTEVVTGVSATITKVGGTAVTVTPDMVLDPSYNGATVTVSTTFDFPSASTASMNKGVSVSAGGVTLDQFTTP